MAISCQKCIHYFITWDPHFPRGCRAMGFKSKRMPIHDVYRVMMEKDCLTFEPKRPKRYPEGRRVSSQR